MERYTADLLRRDDRDGDLVMHKDAAQRIAELEQKLADANARAEKAERDRDEARAAVAELVGGLQDAERYYHDNGEWSPTLCEWVATAIAKHGGEGGDDEG